MSAFDTARQLHSLSWNREDAEFFHRQGKSSYLLDPGHIAMEQAYDKQAWDMFKHILNKSQDLLTRHMEITHPVFNNKVFNLPQYMQDDIFK